MRGKFIVIDGPDGTGKSSLISDLKGYLSLAGLGENFVFTREPGGTKIGEAIRSILLDVNNAEMTDYTEAYLYAAARMQHVEELILPCLHQGKNVISDRFHLASICYQGYGRDKNVDLIKRLNQPAVDMVGDMVYIVLMAEPELGIKRKAGEKELDRLEMASLDFHKRVYEGYRTMMDELPCYEVLASGTREETLAQVLAIFRTLGLLD